MILLDYRDARPIYAQICDGLREQICAGVLRPGDKLPSVRELATQLTINPNTIQRAYRELELQGWVESAAGKGCFVRGVPQNAQTKDLWTELDRIVARLLSAGVEREAVLKHLEKGEKENA